MIIYLRVTNTYLLLTVLKLVLKFISIDIFFRLAVFETNLNWYKQEPYEIEKGPLYRSIYSVLKLKIQFSLLIAQTFCKRGSVLAG